MITDRLDSTLSCYHYLLFFQISNNQKNARRWESDNDVAACNGCDRQFSMTIRRVGSVMPTLFFFIRKLFFPAQAEYSFFLPILG